MYCGPDGQQKVCLSEPGIAVNKKGIVCYIVVVGDSFSSCVSEFVRGTYDESVESVSGNLGKSKTGYRELF